MKKISLIILVIISTTMLFAQKDQTQASKKQGFLFGMGTGGGVLIEKDCGFDTENYGRMSILNLKLGWMVTPQTALCLHIPSGGHEKRAFEAVLATGQHWFSEKFWTMAGMGLAMDMPAFYDIKEDHPNFYFGAAICAGLGYEIWQKNKFVLDIQGRCLYGKYDVEGIDRQSTAFDLLLGFNWY